MAPQLIITSRPLSRVELVWAADAAAVAMRDNPLHRAALGVDPVRRVDVMRSAFEQFLRTGDRAVITAWHEDRLVGIAAHATVGRCRPTLLERVGSAPSAVRAGRSATRILAWQAAWRRRDPPEPHSHLGPVAVLPEFQGTGVGHQLLLSYTSALDLSGHAGYLETDKETNVDFYRRAGFQVVGSEVVIGVRNWFMLRARGSDAARSTPALAPRPLP